MGTAHCLDTLEKNLYTTGILLKKSTMLLLSLELEELYKFNRTEGYKYHGPINHGLATAF